jgi:hypothetical protein
MDRILEFQQGDILFFKCNYISGEKQTGREILYSGEATNHHHRVSSGSFDIYTDKAKLILRCITECIVTHEEHKPITLPPGIWELDQVREYDHLKQMERKVVD